METVVNTSTATPLRSESLPGDFFALVHLFPPSAIHDAVAYENTMEVVNALARVPDLSDGQARYLDTLNILVERYERESHPIDTSDLTGLDLLTFAVESSGTTVQELASVLGLEQGDVNSVLTGGRTITAAEAAKLGRRFKVDPALFTA